MDRRLVNIAAILFINDLGVGLILPLLPFIALHLRAGPLTVGLLMATLPLFSTFAGPPLGALSDRYGRRPILLVSIAGTVVGFLILGLANTVVLLFLARVVDGVSAGNTSTARAAIADITPEGQRTAGIGLAFAAESLGLIMGPGLGGFFSRYGLRVASLVAGGIALLCLLFTALAFPETLKREASQSTVRSAGPRLQFREIIAIMHSSENRMLLSVVFVAQLLIMMMWGTLALYVKQLFQFSGLEFGYISAYAAGVGILSQTLLLRFAISHFKDGKTATAGLSAMLFGLLLIALSNNLLLLLCGVGLSALGFNLTVPTVMGMLSKRASESDQGKTMGLASSVIGAASVIGPIFGTTIFSVSIRGSYVIAALIAVITTIVCLRNIKLLR